MMNSTVSSAPSAAMLHHPSSLDVQLSDREKLILRSVIHNYILAAEPVGSRSLARRYGIDLSPATIRNIMADLEEMGLLTHTHSSAGRIPTDRGYRMYVNDLMQVENLSEDVSRQIRERIEPIPKDFRELLEGVGELMAEVSRLLSVIVAPDISAGILEKVELLRVSAERVMVVIVVNSGVVRTIVLEMTSDITAADLVDAAVIINQRLVGLRLDDMPETIGDRLRGDEYAKNAIIRLFVDFPEKIFKPEARSDMHVIGARHVLEQPEYSSADKVKGIIELVEDRDVIVHLLKERSPGISVTIGNENEDQIIKNFSVISSTYRVGDAVGALGIIGPTRMNYSRLVALVDYTSRVVTERMERGE